MNFLPQLLLLLVCSFSLQAAEPFYYKLWNMFTPSHGPFGKKIPGTSESGFIHLYDKNFNYVSRIPLDTHSDITRKDIKEILKEHKLINLKEYPYSRDY